MKGESSKLKGETAKLNAEVLGARREEGLGEGARPGAVGEGSPSDLLGASMEHGSRVSYWLSIVFLFTQKLIRTGRRGWEGEWRKSRGLRELAGLEPVGETVEICGQIK